MFSRILVPLDGTQLSMGIVPWLAPFVGEHGGELVLLTVIEGDTAGPVSKALTRFEQVARSLQEQGWRVSKLTCVGDPADEILRVAREEQVSMIAMSAHGRRGLARQLLGSVTEAVLHDSPVPVFVIRPGERAREIQKILMPLDGGPLSLWIIPHVAAFSRRFDAEVGLVRVVPLITDDETLEQAEDDLARGKQLLVKSGVDGLTHCRQGDPPRQIIDLAEQQGYDLIAIKTAGAFNLRRRVLGGVTDKLLRWATTPLLVIRDVRAPVGV